MDYYTFILRFLLKRTTLLHIQTKIGGHPILKPTMFPSNLVLPMSQKDRCHHEHVRTWRNVICNVCVLMTEI